MTLKLTLFSQEKEDFVREILIDGDACFSELHRLILEDCGYEEHEGQSFLVCDEEWHVRHRVSLAESEDVHYDEDANLMSETRLGDLLEDEGQRLAYVFDPGSRRYFLIELTENIFGLRDQAAVVKRSYGEPPVQVSGSAGEEEGAQEDASAVQEAEAVEETFYGDDGYESDELDMEGYEIDG